MIGDVSRVTMQRDKHYRQVLLQQGRVLLDADFNEQGALCARGLRQLTRDLLGPHAGPGDALGFTIAVDKTNVTISRGHYYVDGLLAVNAFRSPTDPDLPLTYESQEAFPFEGTAQEIKRSKPYFFYLDVWERTVSWLEDEAIRETALGGPDTALRTQLVWQVRAVDRSDITPDINDVAKATAWLDENVRRHAAADAAPGSRLPLVTAFVDPKDNPDDTPCVADPLGGYSGLENQLYRVEIHAAPTDPDQAATGKLTFKWSRDNGSVVGALVDHVGHDLVVEGVHDTARGFAAGQWVEITDRHGELKGVPGVLVRLIKVERDHLTYDPASASAGVPAVETLVDPIVRRWDHGTRKGQKLQGGAIVLEEDTDYPLERGIKVRFPKQDAGAPARRYAVGDHWYFAARVATADIEWPYTTKTVSGQEVKEYLAREPDGVEHVYAPLAIVSTTAAGSVTSLQRKINVLWTAA
jgi:hypothetical protein